MSKFEVGDRVVVVDSERSFFLARGEVVAVTEAPLWPYTVKLPDEVWEEPVVYSASELEFEHVYDELSKAPSDEDVVIGHEIAGAFFDKVMVDTRPSDAEDMVSNPPHYTSHPSGIQPIQITRHHDFLTGNVLKYVMRAPYKGNEIQDLKKAAQYLQWAIEDAERRA